MELTPIARMIASRCRRPVIIGLTATPGPTEKITAVLGDPPKRFDRYFGLTLTRWQQVGAAIVVVSALIGAIGVATQGWVAYDDWACRAGLPSVACAQPE
jgi:hypothetical protein